jgi:acyl-CoA thioesterase-1
MRPRWKSATARSDSSRIVAGRSITRCAQGALVTLAVVCSSIGAHAQVVALGASNTAGHGLPYDQSYPAQLESMLRARGYDVHVLNAGKSGDTSADMLRRLDSSVPEGTRLVLLHVAGQNDSHRGKAIDGTMPDNIAAIESRLRARHIKTIRVSGRQLFPGLQRSSDGVHFTAEGARGLAARLLPQVVSALGRR